MNFRFLKRRTFWKIVWIAALLFWCFFILSNSFQSGEKSGESSTRVLKIVETTVKKIDPELSVTEKFVRKSAHFFEYFGLGILLSLSPVFIKSRRTTLRHTLFVGLLFAMTDETVQLFSPGREGTLVDVWLDFSAVLLSSLLTFIIILYFQKKSL